MTRTQHPIKRDGALTVITAVVAVATLVFAIIAGAYIFSG